MKTKCSVILAASVALAMAFTLSCSNDGGGGCSSTASHYCSNGTGELKEYGYVSHGGQTYKTVVIGTQTWMAENMNYNNVSGSMCYDNQEPYCGTYGRLYNWATAMEVCPGGWHLPSDDEWNVLFNFVGGSSTAGIYLKATSGYSNNGNGQDTYGFAAIPGGVYFSASDIFDGVGNYGRWWSSSEVTYDNSEAYSKYMDYRPDAQRLQWRKGGLFASVRCVQ